MTGTTILRRVGAGTTTALLLLGASALSVGTALAADTTTVPLKDSQKGSAATAFASGSECSGYSGSETLWHFVVPALDAGPQSTDPDIVGITATFDPASSYRTEIVQNGKGINVYTIGSTTVVDATATISGTGIPEEDAVLVLSHACVGSGGTGGGGGGSTGGTTGTTTGGTTGTSTGGTTGTSTGGSTGTSTGGTTGTSTGGSTGTSTGGTTGTSTGGSTGTSTGGASGGTGTGGDAAPVTTAGAPEIAAPEVPAAPTATVPVTTVGTTDGAATATAGSPVTAAGAPTPTTTTAAQAGAAAAAAPTLPFTGAPVGLLSLYGVAAFAIGCLLMAAGRERDAALVRGAVYRGRHEQPSVLAACLLVVVGAAAPVTRVRRT